MRVVALVALLFAASPAAALDVWVARYTTTGLEGADERQLRERVREELAGAGASVAAADPDPACADDRACVQARLDALSAGAALDIDLVRAGPLLQVTTTLTGARDGEPRSEQRLVQLTDLERGAPLLGDALLDELRALGEAQPTSDGPVDGATTDAAPKAPAPTGAPPLDVTGAEADEPAAASPAPVPSPSGGVTTELPLLGVVGAGVAAGGLVATLVGALVATSGNGVLLDPTSSAGDKELATVYGPLAIAAAVAGGLVTLAGGALAVVGFTDGEPQPSSRNAVASSP